MCTCIRYNQYMGRNYDYENSYDETVATIPKNHYGNEYPIIGICTGFVQEYPLWYDAMNSEGLCMSALAFTGNAHYTKPVTGRINIPSYSMINEILGDCRTVKEAKEYLKDCNVTDEQFNEEFPNSDLHWMVCDTEQSMVVEQTEKGLCVYDNPYDTLTNNPPFDLMESSMEWLDEHMGGDYPEGAFKSRGTETLGVKGDTTSMSRFHRVHYYMEQMKKPERNACYGDVSTLHLLDLVKQTWGATPVNEDYEYTIYSAVYDMENLELMVKPYTSTMVKRISLTNRERRWRI